MDFDVGARLKAIRTERKMTQRDLATEAGVTNGLISLIESNKTSPSVASLKKVLSAFGMSLAEFFDDTDDDGDRFAFGSEDLTALVLEEGSLRSLERVPARAGNTLQMLRIVYQPGADTGPVPRVHLGEEGGFVVEGELTLEVDGRTVVLCPGDAYQFDSQRPHRFRNAAKARCVVISANTPPTV